MKNEAMTLDNSITDLFETLRIIGNGDLANEMAEQLQQAVTASQHTMKKSKLILEVIIEPDTKSDAFRVSGSVKTRLPVEPVKASLFFPTPNGKLSRIDARQRSMFEEESLAKAANQ